MQAQLTTKSVQFLSLKSRTPLTLLLLISVVQRQGIHRYAVLTFYYMAEKHVNLWKIYTLI